MKRKLELIPGEVGMFGYGSLLLLSSMERTLGRTYGRERYVCHVNGWRRTWDCFYPNQRYSYVDPKGAVRKPDNILYLNVTRADVVLNGLVYVIQESDLPGYDKREAVYERVDIRQDLADLDVSGGPVWMYVGLPDYVLRGPVPAEKAAIRRTYIEIVESGIAELGPEFREGYVRSTQPVPEANVIDDTFE